MDYFYAQVEEKRRPMAKGKIIAVCMFSGRTKDSGAVASVNYIGREAGIKAGMPIAYAKKRAPPADSLFVPVDREYYAEVSAHIDEIIRKTCDRVVQASIDEWNIEDEKAAEWFLRVAESTTEHVSWPIPYVRSFYFLGKIHENRGEMEKAREYYRRFYEYWKDGDMDRERVEEAKSKLGMM